jgi:hypothetical protein
MLTIFLLGANKTTSCPISISKIINFRFLKPQLPRPSAPVKHHTRGSIPERAYSEPRAEFPKPILFVDIKIGNANERITLYEGDNLDVVAEQFLRK